MAHVFCTLAEAAKKLKATEGEVEVLLGKGMLREFRDGPHRLVKTADVGTLVRTRPARPKNRNCPPTPQRTRQTRTVRSPSARTNRSAETRLPRCAVATVTRTVTPTVDSQPRNQPRRRPPATRESGRPAASRTAHTPRHSVGPRHQAVTSPPAPSVKQWFWSGLTQDRPLVIAILSGLALLILTGTVVGVCLLAEMG